MACEGLKESCYKLGESYSYGGVKVSTGFKIDTSACPGSDGLVKNRKRIIAKNVIHVDFSRPAYAMAA
jgi:hypothetical protein